MKKTISALTLIVLSFTMIACTTTDHIGASRPSSMVQPGPDTEEGSTYKNAEHITAFSQLHMDGTGLLGMMPRVGELEVDQEAYRSTFNPTNGATGPAYYSVTLDESNIQVDITAINQVALYRLTFPETKESHVMVDVSHAFSAFKTGDIRLRDDKTMEGTATYELQGTPIDIAFSFQFSKPFRRRGVWKDGEIRVGENRAEADANSTLGAFAYFYTNEGETILMKVGISSTNVEDARKVLEAEFSGWDFDAVREKSERIWNQ